MAAEGNVVVEKCSICELVQWKYRCPKCLTKYCSADCCKKHKEIGCLEKSEDNLQPNDNSNKLEYMFVTEDTIPIEKLELLREDSDLQEMLANPHLRKMLIDLSSSSNPAKVIGAAMKIPIFVEFADKCIQILEPGDKE